MKRLLSNTKNTLNSSREKLTGWGPVSAILVTVGTFFGAQVLAGIFIGVYGSIKGLSNEQIQTQLHDSIAWWFASHAIIQVGLLFLLWIFLRARNISWPDLGIRNPSIKGLFYAVPVFVLYLMSLFVAISAIDAIAPNIDVQQKQQLGFDTIAYGNDLLLIFIGLVILTPIVEEIVMRGFLYGGLKNGMPKIHAAIITSIIFAIAHLQLGSGAPPLWVAAIHTFILSMALVWLRERTGTIWAGVLVHMMKNGLAFISIFILKLA